MTAAPKYRPATTTFAGQQRSGLGGEEMENKVLIAGSTGAVGKELIKLILASERYSEVHHVGRGPLAIEHEKLVQHVSDFEQLDEVHLQPGMNHAFCTLGTTRKKAGSLAAFQRIDKGYVVEFARLAKRQGAKTFAVISSLGANPKAFSKYLRTKGEMEQALRELQFESLQILRPSLLHGKREETRIVEGVGYIVLRSLSPLLRGPLGRYRPVAFAQVAMAMFESSGQDNSAVVVLESEQISCY